MKKIIIALMLCMLVFVSCEMSDVANFKVNIDVEKLNPDESINKVILTIHPDGKNDVVHEFTEGPFDSLSCKVPFGVHCHASLEVYTSEGRSYYNAAIADFMLQKDKKILEIPLTIKDWTSLPETV